MHSIFYLKTFSNGLGGTGVSNGGKVFHTSAFGNLNFANIIIGKKNIYYKKRERKEKQTNKETNQKKKRAKRVL